MKPKIVVSFSGGKDSQACLILAVKKYGVENVEAVFCDTGWEHPITYKHVQYVANDLGLKLTILKNKKIDGFRELCIKMKCFPIPSRRVCTSVLKIKPMIDWIIEQDSSMIIIQGIRAGESKERSAMPFECNYFAEYFIDGKKNLYRKRDVKKWCKTHDASIIRPIFNWTAQEVIDNIIKNNQEVNPLYKKGASRVGCFPCIMSRHSEIKIVAKDPEMAKRLINLEKDVKEAGDKKHSGFFTKGYIPDRYCKTNGTGSPTAQEVFDYVLREENLMEDMFEPEGGYSCMSLYHGLCE
jgi:3'-phosphoadenosine 5'-phosphosulfate sulfotransferase (PAPS reductase)/FAD synthetase